jgi:ubiquinol-cytochrome c reductase cytochrome b subunit
VTPAHIVPEWYFLPFYAILRAITFNIGPITSKLGGVIAMFGSIAVLFVLPWLDTSKVRSMRYRPVARLWFVLFVVACVWLGYLGGKPAEGIYVIQAQIATAYYFAFFLVILPLLGLFEKPTAQPKSIADSVLKRDKAPVAAVAQAAE